MHAATIAMILAATVVSSSPVETTPREHADAVELYACRFGAEHDANHDNWPDGWTRRRGSGYPHYVAIELASEPTASEGRALRVGLNGGGAAAHGPPVSVESVFSYLLHAKVKTSELEHDQVHLSVTFYDARQKPLETFTSEKISEADSWKLVALGPVSPVHETAVSAVIGVHVEPGERADLKGVVWVDDVWFSRLPRMTLRPSRPLGLYLDPKDVEVVCEVWGTDQQAPELAFELLGVEGDSLASEIMRVEGRALGASRRAAPDQTAQRAYSGSVVWKPPVPGYGHYEVSVAMRSAAGVVHRRRVSLAVGRRSTEGLEGEFGWSLPRGEDPLPIERLQPLLSDAGINWLKFPLWYSEHETDRAETLVRFAQRLERDGIEMIGLIDRPPEDVAGAVAENGEPSAAEIFTQDPAVWLPSLEPIMTRLSLRIRWWQLGDDHDLSFVGYPDLGRRISQIRANLFQFGQKAYVGLPWNWVVEPPHQDVPPWEFLSYSADPPLAGSEVSHYLDGSVAQQPKRFVAVEPLPRDQYDLPTRARDLMLQMMSAKMGQADGIFLVEPFDENAGVMHADGSPGPLFLPWRTTALQLRGAGYLGSIRLPGGSDNHTFVRGGHAVMVLWSATAREEHLFLGEHVRQIDLWGRDIETPHDAMGHRIRVTPVPSFVEGVEPAVAQWRMALALDKTRLPSVFGEPHANAVHVKNFFPQTAVGTMRIVTPKVLRTVPEEMKIRLAPGATETVPFEVLLPLGATSGAHDIRIDFDVTTDRRYEFTVYRQLEIGLGEVVIQLSTRLDPHGDLVVEQQTTNHTDERINFRFFLYAPQRRSKRSHILGLDRGQEIKTYRFPGGRELLGKVLWLRCEEIDGPRIFNHRVVAEE
jgi:hypothetical protein